MPSTNTYTYKSSGTNNQGNHYCARDYGSSSSNSNSYHYSNSEMRLMGFTGRNGSFYYSNPNGSTYSNNGNGGSTYTSASGYRTCSGYGKK
ncbi:uncharacterized protein ColSpa_01846 [Colletotrichum spaethianum]|uniref:Uncharacterized protein n=1 Tax=Colletotrichum spaethianum TaxID=700344 RepID=A0AA37L931_9PEZI|nr:uncharacterized protein ColSpa_01846 [Colletotrichum spaethianum]GKT41665.1 hypothetical protein ColSpa_01846 [Colletotrichum spaethianum]